MMPYVIFVIDEGQYLQDYDPLRGPVGGPTV